MKASDIDIAAILNARGVVIRRRHPELARAIDWQVRSGRLRSVLPGILVAAGVETDLMTRAAAVQAWNPDAVILGRAAAKLTFWSELHVDDIEVAARNRSVSSPGFVLRRRRIPPELILERKGLRCTVPALTALDLSTEIGAEAIDTVLHSRQATLADLHGALDLTPQRTGNLDRRRLLLDSRDEPWSFAEREAHRLLREAGITGWRANVPVPLLGVTYFLDIAFEDIKLAIEIDGRAYHGPDQFDSDRWRQNDIVLDGWTVLRFSAETVIEHGQIFIQVVLRAIG